MERLCQAKESSGVMLEPPPVGVSTSLASLTSSLSEVSQVRTTTAAA